MSKEIEIEVTDSLKKQFIPFAGGTLLNNLPSIDGFLPVHRKVILSMMRNNRTHKSSYKKTASVMGEVMMYYVFGDAPLYGSIVNMANNGMNNPLIDGYGQWGNKFSSNGVPAAQRYTSCRLTPYAEAMYSGVNKQAVEMKANYDNTTDEVVIMPSMIPNILTNTSQSIAVGEASKIPSHNLESTCDAIINYLSHENNDKLIEDIQCPDLSSGGSIVYDKELFKSIYNTGRGSFTLIGSYRYNEKINRIEIYEVPYETTVETIHEKLVDAVEKGNMKEVSSSRIGTGKDGLRLDIDLKKNTDVEGFILKLRRYTPFESKMSVNFTMLDLDWKTPKLMTLQDIVDRWIQHRINCISNETEYDISQKEKRIHLLEGLGLVKDNLEKVVKVIRESKNDDEAIGKLISDFGLSDKQSEYVAEMKVRNLNSEYVDKRIEELSKLYNDASELKILLGSEVAKKSLIKDQLEQVKKDFSKPGYTKVIDIEELQEYKEVSEQPEDYNLKVFITKDLYLKKIPLTSMRGKFTNRLKEDDSFTFEEELTNTGEVIVFTDKYNVYKKRLSDISDTRPSDLGEYIPSLFDYEKDEHPLFAVPLKKEFNQTLVLGFDDGTVAKINTSAYYTKQNRQILKKGYANKNLIYISYGEGLEYMKAKSTDGYTVIREMSSFGAKDGRSSNGNNFMKLNEGSTIESYSAPNEEEIEKYLIKTAGRGKK